MDKKLLKIRVTGIDHVVLHVRDIAISKRFYVGLLGMEVDHEGPRQVFLTCGQQRLALFESTALPDTHTVRDLNHMALEIESGSYDEVTSSLEELGIQVTGRTGDPHCIYFMDPDGHQLQLLPPRR